jgi:hypothetical protein
MFRVKLMQILILVLFLNSFLLFITVFKSKNKIFDNQDYIFKSLIKDNKSLDQFRSFKRDIKKYPRIFCIILTNKKNFETKTKAIFETWVNDTFR